MNFLETILSPGTSREHSNDLNWRLRITNGIALSMIFFTALFILNAVVKGEDYLKPVYAMIVYFVVLLLNKLRFINLSRIVLAAFPSLVITVIHLSIISPEAPAYTSLFACQFALSFTPWLIFSSNQSAKIYGLSLFNLGLLLSYKFDVAFGVNNEYHVFEQGVIGFVAAIGAFFILMGLFSAVSYLNKKQAKANRELIDKMQDSHQQMEEKTNQLNDYIQQIEIAKKEDERRKWFNDGITYINQLIQEKQEEDGFKDELMGYLVKYMKANQAALFELQQEQEEPYLELTSCYAYNRKKYLHKRVELGEGLTGQCVLEADIIYLTEVPDNYVNITSGLGKALPKAIMIVPLISNEQVEGVIEIASFQEYEQYQIDFLTKAGNSLAAYLVNDKVSRKTQHLLEDSRYKAEMLKNQEEEMRQNMEEMGAVQEELMRKQKEFERLIKEKDEKIRLLSQSET